MLDTPPAFSWPERVETIGGKRRDLVVVAGLVAAVVFSGLVVWGRGAPPRVAPPATSASPSAQASPSSAGGPVVHVAGAVRKPGVFALPPGARVADALELAGGALPRADLDALNLAAPVVDGAQILVRFRSDDSVASAPAPLSSSTSSATVSLNTADQAALETIPGIGPVTATAILEYRASIGNFESLEQLLDVTGIGPATLESMRPYITL